MPEDRGPYVSRAGLKLAAALREFQIRPRGAVCLDLGSHAGGFVDCLLQHGAAKVYCVDPGYGVLDLKLRNDPRVVVQERTNALTYVAPELCDLVTIDVGWTQQRLVLPPARRSLKQHGAIITLVKPHYEAPRKLLRGGVLPEANLAEVLATVREDVADLGLKIGGELRSPIEGHGGNAEYLWILSG